MPPQKKTLSLSLVDQWFATLTPKERQLHELAAVMLKKSLQTDQADNDNGSYFADRCHAFKQWAKQQTQQQQQQQAKA
jgi:hypothetical protein